MKKRKTLEIEKHPYVKNNGNISLNCLHQHLPTFFDRVPLSKKTHVPLCNILEAFYVFSLTIFN